MSTETTRLNIPYLLKTVIVWLLYSLTACTTTDHYYEQRDTSDTAEIVEPTPSRQREAGSQEEERPPLQPESRLSSPPSTQHNIELAPETDQSREANRENADEAKVEKSNVAQQKMEAVGEENKANINTQQNAKNSKPNIVQKSNQDANVDNYSLPIDAPEFDPSKGGGSDEAARKTKTQSESSSSSSVSRDSAEPVPENSTEQAVPKPPAMDASNDIAPVKMTEQEMERSDETASAGSKPEQSLELNQESTASQGLESDAEVLRADEKGAADKAQEAPRSNASSEAIDNAQETSNGRIHHEHDGYASHSHPAEDIDDSDFHANHSHGHGENGDHAGILGSGHTRVIEGRGRPGSGVKWNLQRRPEVSD